MTEADDVDAAWAAVHDATPPGWFARRGRVALAVLALVVAACLPQPQGPPAEFIDFMTNTGRSFTVAAPPDDVVPASELLARVRADGGGGILPPFVPPGSPVGQPIYGLLACIDVTICGQGEEMPRPGQLKGFWLVPFPGTPGAASGIAWSLVDAHTGRSIESDGP